MRILLLVSVVVLAFLAVRCFQPGVVTAGTETQAPTEAGVRFMAPPAVQVPVPQELQSPKGSPESNEVHASPTAPIAPSSWPSNLLEASGGAADELGIAAALVHGVPADVQGAAQALPPDRALLLESFAWAIAGERQVALSLSERIAARDQLDGREKGLFEAALTGKAPVPASTGSTPVVRAMEMALLVKEAKANLAARRYPEAARTYSALLLGELQAAWPADAAVLGEWTKGLNEAQREHRWHPRGDWPSVEVKVGNGDSLISIRKRYVSEHPGAVLCTGLIERANRIKGYLQPGQPLRIPTDPARILVDLEARWALFFLGDEVAAAWPVAIGRPGEDTPPGDYSVRNKLENPPWMKEGQEPIPFGDPRNPLGTRWIGWSKEGAKTPYGFHGTWEPASIGKAASDGCIRFRNEDVEQLFQVLPEGAPIRIEG
ncbi:MAG: hypothetical protein EXS08_14520 [Planctomycetes bacterium]|nr:hypothetical protein [Planctomycetota bacterium]